MKIIAISGWKKSGKDTAAELLIKEFGCQRVAFADSLKKLCASEYGVPLEYFHVQDLKEKPLLDLPITPKDAFSLNISKFMFREFRDEQGRIADEVYVDEEGQFMGVIGRTPVQLYHTPRSLAIFKGSGNRFVDPDYWIKRTVKDIKELNATINRPEDEKVYVISDLRYRNETNKLKAAFGDDLVLVKIDRFDDCDSTDPSERDLDNYEFDIVIKNRGTLEEFTGKVKELAESVIG